MSIKSEIKFSIKILKTFNNSENSIVYSPFSILNNLAIIYAGSDGKTAKQLSLFLGEGKTNAEIIQYYSNLIKSFNKNVNDGNDSNFELISSNCLFISDELKMLPSFIEIMENFDTKYHCLNFEETEKCAQEINKFISKNTHGKIEGIVSENDIVKDANLFIVNALYFSGDWKISFEEIDGIFQNQKAKMLSRTVRNEGWNLVENEKWQCLGIPFKNQNCWLHILLPRKEENCNLPELLENFDEHLCRQCVSKNEVEKVKVVIPKFLLETKISLDETLKKMGITEIFKFESVRKIFADPHYVDKAIHFTKFEVNEHGVKAAAATVMRLVCVSATTELDMKYFRANHPFIYFVTLVEGGQPCDVKNILLMGQYCGNNSTKDIEEEI